MKEAAFCYAAFSFLGRTQCMPPLVVIPTYQEADNIGRMVVAIKQLLPETVVLVVDDASPDDTARVAQKAGAEILKRTGQRGLGPAYREGFQWALQHDFDPIFQMDADFSHDPADLLRLWTGAPLTLGSRYLPGGGTRNWELSRRLLSRYGSFYARSWLGLNLSDLTGGFKCWQARTLAQLSLSTLTSTGYAFQIETTWRAIQLGFQVAEVPILFTERSAGSSKMNARIALEAAFAVPQLRWRGF
jgi:dolichol-phosphate mannosyltransferase